MKESSLELITRLALWARESRMTTPGAVCLALVVTRYAFHMGLPLDAEALLTGRGGQILGLGRRNVQDILAEYGVTHILASAGGRTSRGNISKMRAYVAWLNENVDASNTDLTEFERWWVGFSKEVTPYQPRLRLSVDPKLSLRAILRGLLEQADRFATLRHPRGLIGEPSLSERPSRSPSRRTVPRSIPATESVMRHLVGAKLELVLGHEVEAHGAFVADGVTDRQGDYQVEDVVIHVTTSPGEALLRKCSDNLDQGLRPLVITTYKNVPVAETMAENKGLSGRVDVFDVEQFVASNILELSKFKAASRKVTVQDLVSRYNRLAECENNPGLLIKNA